MTRSEIVIAYDFSPTADVALQAAVELAARDPAPLSLYVGDVKSSGPSATAKPPLEHDHPAPQIRRPPGSSPVVHAITVLDAGQDYLAAERCQHDLLGRLRGLFDTRRPEHPVELYVHARIGVAAETILALAEEVGATMIICGSHGRGAVGRLLLGSVSEAVLHGARCPVLIARPCDYAPTERLDVIEVTPTGLTRPLPHRYSYENPMIVMRPNDWPIS